VEREKKEECRCDLALPVRRLDTRVGGDHGARVDVLLLLKIALAPALVGAASLAGRRFGARVGGWLIGFPVVAGPVLWLYAREQGPAFASGAAAGTVMGTVSLCGFLLVYAWSARRLAWPVCMLLGWLAFAAGTLALDRTPALAEAPLLVRLLAAFAALAATGKALPRVQALPAAPRPRHDLLLRMLATGALVLTLTGVARLLGPRLSGLVTPFPVATTILVVFAHRQAGAGGVVAVYGGFIPSLFSFASFCAALSFGLAHWSLPAAFAAALAVSVLSQTVVLRAVRDT
jgi:hypothetical protein